MSDQGYPSKVLEPAVYQPALLTESLYWIEPELPHKQVIVVTTEQSAVYHTTENQGVRDWGVMLNMAKRQFRQLAMELHLQAEGDKWKGLVAFICYLVPLELGGEPSHFAIRFAMPLLDFIMPEDSQPQGLRVLALEQAFSDAAYPQLRLVPSVFIGKPDTVKQLYINVPGAFRQWANTWGVESLLLVARDEAYAVDSTTAIMRYVPALNRLFGWTCGACARRELKEGETAYRQVVIDYNVPGGYPLPACPQCGLLAGDEEDDDL